MDVYAQAWTSISNLQTMTSNTSNMWSSLTYSNLLSLSNILNGDTSSFGQSNWNFASNLAVSTSNALSNMFGAPVIVSATKSGSTQNIPAATLTKITQFNAVASIDTSAGAWNATTGVFTCKKPGYYNVNMTFSSSNLSWSGTSSWWGTAEIRVNNAYKTGQQTLFNPTWLGASINLGPAQCLLYLTTGNTVDFHVYHTYGASIPTFNTVVSISEIR
jgi:hypothetical protein